MISKQLMSISRAIRSWELGEDAPTAHTMNAMLRNLGYLIQEADSDGKLRWLPTQLGKQIGIELREGQTTSGKAFRSISLSQDGSSAVRGLYEKHGARGYSELRTASRAMGINPDDLLRIAADQGLLLSGGNAVVSPAEFARLLGAYYAATERPERRLACVVSSDPGRNNYIPFADIGAAWDAYYRKRYADFCSAVQEALRNDSVEALVDDLNKMKYDDNALDHDDRNPDYSVEAVCDCYIWRHGNANLFEYNLIYRMICNDLRASWKTGPGFTPPSIVVASLGCGSGLDLVALLYARACTKAVASWPILYHGVDTARWRHGVFSSECFADMMCSSAADDGSAQPGGRAEVELFGMDGYFSSDAPFSRARNDVAVFLFAKSLSEPDDCAIERMVDNIRNAQFAARSIYVCILHRHVCCVDDDHYRDRWWPEYAEAQEQGSVAEKIMPDAYRAAMVIDAFVDALAKQGYERVDGKWFEGSQLLERASDSIDESFYGRQHDEKRERYPYFKIKAVRPGGYTYPSDIDGSPIFKIALEGEETVIEELKHYGVEQPAPRTRVHTCAFQLLRFDRIKGGSAL